MTTTVQKRNKTTELFTIDKVARSIQASCVSAGSTKTEAQRIAEKIASQVNDTMTNKSKITSKEIRAEIATRLRKYHHHAADLYLHYRSLS